MINIKFEIEKNRSAAYDGEKLVGEMTFQPTATYWSIDHTFVDTDYRGQQIAQKLMESLVSGAKEASMQIEPVCSFAVKSCQENPEYGKLVVDPSSK